MAKHQLQYHRNFSTYILMLNKKGASKVFVDNGITVYAIKHDTNDIWVLDRRTSTGAIFNTEGVLQRGIQTDGTAVSFIDPDTLSIEEQARLVAMFPKKL